MATTTSKSQDLVHIDAGRATLDGYLRVPKRAEGLVLFAQSSSSEHRVHDQYVAETLFDAGLATLRFDLLTEEEQDRDHITRDMHLNIDLLSQRLSAATKWVLKQSETKALNIGYFAFGAGAAATLITVVNYADAVHAVVAYGGRPDLAQSVLVDVRSPTLLIVGEDDAPVIDLNRAALEQLRAEKKLEVVSGAGHEMMEPGTFEEMVRLACTWFQRHLTSSGETS